MYVIFEVQYHPVVPTPQKFHRDKISCYLRNSNNLNHTFD